MASSSIHYYPVTLVMRLLQCVLLNCFYNHHVAISNYLYTSLCLQIPLPESVTGRYAHSLTTVTMSPHCVWLVIVGGYKKLEWKDVGGGVKKPMHRLITDTNRLIMIIELGK